MRTLWISVVLFPTAALAEVCDKERPLWNGGQVTAWQEALYHFTSPVGWPLLVALILALIFQRRWLWLLCAMCAGLVAWTAYSLPHLDEISVHFSTLMQQEGCVGPPHLSIALGAAISTLSIYGAVKPRRTEKDTTCSKD